MVGSFGGYSKDGGRNVTYTATSFDERAPFCKTDILGGDPGLRGYSLYICDTDKVTETVLRYITSSELETTLVSSIEVTSNTHSHAPVTETRAPAPSTPVSTIVGAVIGSVGRLHQI